MKRRKRNEIKKLPTGYAQGTESSPTAKSARGGGFYVEHDKAVDNTMRGHIALFAAILTQQLMDAKSRSNKPEKAYYREQALHWLFDNKRDFQMVCDFAGLDPDYTRERLLAAQKRGFIWREGDGTQAVKERVRLPRARRREILIELGLFPRLEPKHAPVRSKRPARNSHIRALRQFSTQLELSF